MQVRSDTGQVRFRTGGCRTGRMQDRWNTGRVEYRTGGMQSCRISRIQDMWDAGQVGRSRIRIQKR